MFSSVPEILIEIKKGNFVIVVDDNDRENEGDLFIPAEKISVKQMAFLIEHSSGIICVPMTESRLNELGIPRMTVNNSDNFDTSFSVSVDAIQKVGSGISAKDRTETIKALINPASTKKDFGMPGHIFPLYSKQGGVLERNGHTESAVDLCRLSGLFPAGVIGELMNKDGSVKSLEQIKDFSIEHEIKIISVNQLVEFIKKNPEKIKLNKKLKLNKSSVEFLASANVPTNFGEFNVTAFSFSKDNSVHLALVKGIIKEQEVLVRIHSSCITGETFHSLKCDCGIQLNTAMKKINEEGKGIIIYLFQEGRGIGLTEKIKAYSLQEKGFDTVEANNALGYKTDLRDFSVAAEILKKFKVKKVKLMTNNPEKISSLESNGIKVSKRIPLKVIPSVYAADYFKTKKTKMGHLL